MEEKDSEQSIDQQSSAASIDQITKVPASKPKVKNPKRVAAGKKLSQYNKKARQSRDAAVKEEQKPIQENQENDGGDQWLPKTSFSSVIALLGLGLAAIDLFLRYKSQPAASKIDDYSQQSREREWEINSNEVDIKKQPAVPKTIEPQLHRKSFGGME